MAFFLAQMVVETDACIDWPFAQTNGYGETHYEGQTHTVHVLMCELKHGAKPSAAHEAAHSCGRRICFNHRHLRWATRSENIADAISHGTKPRGEMCAYAKLTEADVKEIRQLKGSATQDELAARFGVHRAHIKDIQMRRRWGWLI